MTVMLDALKCPFSRRFFSKKLLSYTNLNSKKGQIWELLDKTTDLLSLAVVVQPWPALHSDLPQNNSQLLAPECRCGKSEHGRTVEQKPTSCWRDSTNHSSPRKLQAMSTSPLYTSTRYFWKHDVVLLQLVKRTKCAAWKAVFFPFCDLPVTGRTQASRQLHNLSSTSMLYLNFTYNLWLAPTRSAA